jgi:DNA polymerase-3 subunit epsilon
MSFRTALVIDTETTGLLERGRPPPRLVRLAWISCDERGVPLSSECYRIRPDPFRIPRSSTMLHRITEEQAIRKGHPIGNVLEWCAAALHAADCIVGHNLSFDLAVLEGEYHRLRMASPFSKIRRICTMKTAASAESLQKNLGGRWPGLLELHWNLFGEGIPAHHSARADAWACARCYQELIRRGEQMMPP